LELENWGIGVEFVVRGKEEDRKSFRNAIKGLAASTEIFVESPPSPKKLKKRKLGRRMEKQM